MAQEGIGFRGHIAGRVFEGEGGGGFGAELHWKRWGLPPPDASGGGRGGWR